MTTMNKVWKKGLILFTVGSMLLTGCSRKGGKGSASLDMGTLSNTSVVMTVGSEGVRYSEVKAYCYFLKCQYEGSFGDGLWQYGINKKGETIGTEAKQEIVNMITQVKIICAQAADQEVALTNDEIDEALSNAETLIENASEEDKKEYSLNVQEISEIYQENALANKMFYIATNDADTNISDEEAKQISIQVLEVMTNGTNKNDVKVSLDETGKQEALTRITKMKKNLKSQNDFLEYATDNSDATEVEMTVGSDSDRLEKTALDSAFTLKSGETSDIIEGEQGYYLIYCVKDNDEDATYQRKEEIIQQRQTKMFMGKYKQWLANNAVNISENFWNEFDI